MYFKNEGFERSRPNQTAPLCPQPESVVSSTTNCCWRWGWESYAVSHLCLWYTVFLWNGIIGYESLTPRSLIWRGLLRRKTCIHGVTVTPTDLLSSTFTLTWILNYDEYQIRRKSLFAHYVSAPSEEWSKSVLKFVCRLLRQRCFVRSLSRSLSSI